MTTNKCIKCEEVKDYEEFYKDKRAPLGISSTCKLCHKTRMSILYLKNKSHKIAYQQQYYKDNQEHCLARQKEYALEHKENIKAYQASTRGKAVHAAYRKRNAKKVSAKEKLHYHVRTGKIQCQPCEMCGCTNVHGHHDDYDKPLDVRWLCPTHHKEWHRNNGEGANGHD